MNEIAVPEKTEPKASKAIRFLPFMCENAPLFKDIDRALELLPPEGLQHKQREIWKMAPKKDDKGKVVRDADGYMIMVKIITRNSKVVTVKNVGGLCSFVRDGIIEPMDYTDVKEVISLLEK